MAQHPQTISEATESELFRLLVENVQDYAIFVTDPDGRVRSWNPGAERLLGYAEGDIVGRPAALLFTPEDVETGVPQREMRTAMEMGRDEDARWHVRKDGTRFWSAGTVTPLWDEGRKLRGFARIMRDCTAQKQSEDALRAALADSERVVDERREIETRFTTLVKNVKDYAIFTMDLGGCVTSWNVAAERTLGYSEAEILGRPFALIFTPEDIRAAIPETELRIAREVGRAENLRWHVRKGDERFWAVGIVTPTHDAGGRHIGYTKILRDMTEQKLAEQLLERAHKAAETQVRERTADLRMANERLQNEIEGHTRAERRLNAQYVATKVLAESPDLVAAVPQVMEAVCGSTGWAWAAVWMADPTGERLGLAHVWYVPSADLDEFRAVCRDTTFSPGEGLPGRVWAAGQPAWVEDVAQEQNFPRRHAAARAGLRAAFVFPIRLGPAVVGVVEFLSRRAEPPDEKIVEMMVAIGSQIGQFIERKRVEEGLRLFRALIDHTTDGIEVIDPGTGRFLDANEKACAVHGYTREEYLGLCVSDIDPLVSAHPWTELIEGRRAAGFQIFESRHRRKDGSTFPVEVNLNAIRLDRDYLVAVVRDITDRRLLEDQYRQAQKMEAFGQLAGGVAHDFNNLLTIISGYSDMLLASLRPDDQNRDMVAEIHNAGERAALLTRQLLMFSRKQVVQPQVLDLNVVVAGSEKMLGRLIEEDVTLASVLRPGLDRVKVDPGQVEQIILNLVVNARDAMPRGGRITIETANVDLDACSELTHAKVEPGRYVLLVVSDTGCGMTEEVKRHLFEPFFTTKEVGKGTGLGLATVFGIVNQSGGHIGVSSEVGRGTTFRIYLPSVVDVTQAGETQEGPAAVVTGTETILLVEDDKEVRTVTRRTLLAHGYTVLEAADGGEAIRMCEGHAGPLHLVITDVVMPRMGGREAAEALRSRHAGLKVLYISGYTDDAVVRHGIVEAGPVKFLVSGRSGTLVAGQLGGRVGMRPSNTMAKWFNAAFQPTMGIVHFFDAS